MSEKKKKQTDKVKSVCINVSIYLYDVTPQEAYKTVHKQLTPLTGGWESQEFRITDDNDDENVLDLYDFLNEYWSVEDEKDLAIEEDELGVCMSNTYEDLEADYEALKADVSHFIYNHPVWEKMDKVLPASIDFFVSYDDSDFCEVKYITKNAIVIETEYTSNREVLFSDLSTDEMMTIAQIINKGEEYKEEGDT